MLYVMWALIGFFASTMTCLGMRILSDLPNKAHASVATIRGPLPSASWRALGLFFLFLVGNIGLWAFLERIGASLKINPAEMGIVFAVLKLLGSVAAFSVAAAGGGLGALRAACLVLGAVGVGLALLTGATGFAGFALGAWIWEFAFTCGCVFQTAAMARSDLGGRAVTLVPAVFALSSMAGPGLAGQIAAGGSFGGLLAFALASALVPVLACLLRPRVLATGGA